MSELDIGRLKWRLIEVVSDFLREQFGDEGAALEETFKRQYELQLLARESEEATESSRLLHLVEEFRPALGLVLQHEPKLDRLVQRVSPVFNYALSSAEKLRLESELKSQESSQPRRGPARRAYHVYGGPEDLRLLSVGIDVGSSTSHLIFSKLALTRQRSFSNPTNRFQLVHREILYESEIILTPLIDRFTIDIDAVAEFCKREYEKAGISPDMVDSGAVIVTGESAKKRNAEEIVERLSSETGKFVSAVAGPNYESALSIMGSGIVDLSRETKRTIMNVDIGGGTSNLAIARNGMIHSTACINVGGRLLGVDESFRIWRIDEPTYFVMKELGMNYEIGDVISEADARRIARAYAEALLEVMKGPAVSRIANELMMTNGLDFECPIDQYSFSGGVAEFIYGCTGTFDDIGRLLAEEMQSLLQGSSLEVVEPPFKIRATVIGAGAFSLSVSGSTCYFDKDIGFPIRNIPVIPVDVTTKNYSPERVKKEIERAFARFDRTEGGDLVAIYFKDSLYRSYTWLQEFVRVIEAALPRSVSEKKIVILLFQTDIGKMVGLMVRRETSIQHNLICLDELSLEEGDWIDIGAPLGDGQSFPVTVKSLVFNQSKGYS
jgi:ethanolamine utilization protein EutA